MVGPVKAIIQNECLLIGEGYILLSITIGQNFYTKNTSAVFIMKQEWRDIYECNRLFCKGQRKNRRQGTDLYGTQVQIKSMHVLLDEK